MRPCGLITLITDFGLADGFAGQMKGSVLRVFPDANLIDISHDVPPQAVSTGAYLLETAYTAFPPGTVHVAVIDPGVGTERAAVVVRTDRYFFVGPDNGVLARALDRESIVGAHRIEDPAVHGVASSATFEGRDRFAPAAAWLLRGVRPESMGTEHAPLVGLPRVDARYEAGVPSRVPVVHVDRFGNVVLDLRAEDWERVSGRPPDPGARFLLRAPGGEVHRLQRTFGDAPDGSPFLIVNSAGYVELAVNGGDASSLLDLDTGASVELTIDVL